MLVSRLFQHDSRLSFCSPQFQQLDLQQKLPKRLARRKAVSSYNTVGPMFCYWIFKISFM